MSISGSMYNALTGLNASSRLAELISANVANAMTEGYGVRTLELSSQVLGGQGYGVHIDGVRRNVDEGLIENRRLAGAEVGSGTTTANFFARMEQVVGTPDDPGSLTGRIAAFESALLETSAHPESQARQANLLRAIQGLVSHINDTSAAIQQSRVEADQQIAVQVESLNNGLEAVRKLNLDIQESLLRGQDPSSLLDLRQKTIDGISSIVPLRQVPRANGQVALFTPTGAILLDGRAARFEFSATEPIVPEMTLQSGALSGLTLNGRPVDLSSERSLIAGGSLAAQFRIRDEAAVTAQAQLDAVARDLVERFQDPALDTTRSPGDPGIFTDAGSAFDPANEVALSERLSVNALIDPGQGGALWRLRDGLGATAPGNVGDGSLLVDMTTALTARRLSGSAEFSGVARNAGELSAEFLSGLGAQRQAAEATLGFASTKHETLRQMEYEIGVDTDAEMQKLLLVEQAFAANAKVMTAADEMLQLLMQI